jgi:hypothetical protein
MRRMRGNVRDQESVWRLVPSCFANISNALDTFVMMQHGCVRYRAPYVPLGAFIPLFAPPSAT